MHVSQETPEQTTTRLRRVMAQARLEIFDGAYAFYETPVAQFPGHRVADALAFVRDEEVWSFLAPADATVAAEDKFVLFSFHFPPALDNSGFVGWLASHLKATIGTGILVVCGQNAGQGGIFDYWGAPEVVAQKVIAEVQRLRGPL